MCSAAVTVVISLQTVSDHVGAGVSLSFGVDTNTDALTGKVDDENDQ